MRTNTTCVPVDFQPLEHVTGGTCFKISYNPHTGKPAFSCNPNTLRQAVLALDWLFECMCDYKMVENRNVTPYAAAREVLLGDACEVSPQSNSIDSDGICCNTYIANVNTLNMFGSGFDFSTSGGDHDA